MDQTGNRDYNQNSLGNPRTSTMNLAMNRKKSEPNTSKVNLVQDRQSMSPPSQQSYQLHGVEDDSFLDDFSDFADEIGQSNVDSRHPPPNISDTDIFRFMNGNQRQSYDPPVASIQPTQISPSNSQIFSNYNIESSYKSEHRQQQKQMQQQQQPNSYYQPYMTNTMPMNSGGGSHSQQISNSSFPMKKVMSGGDRNSSQQDPPLKTSSGSVGGKSSSGQSVGSHSDSSNNSRMSESGRSRNEISPDPRKRVAEKKRQDRNSREQQRSFKISKQIDQLKQILEESGVKVKNSKYDILAGVATYVKQLQSRSSNIQNEIRSIDQQMLVKSANIIPQDPTMSYPTGNSNTSSSKVSEVISVPSLISSGSMVVASSSSSRVDPFRSIATSISDRNFRQHFMQSQMALALAATDGRIFECNQAFQDITGLQKEHVLHASIFKLVDPSMLQEAYINIGLLLQPSKNMPNSSAMSTTTSGTYYPATVDNSVKVSSDGASMGSQSSGKESKLKDQDRQRSDASVNNEQRSFLGNNSTNTSSSVAIPTATATGKRSRASMEQSSIPQPNTSSSSILTLQTHEFEGAVSRSFVVGSLIISAYDGKHLSMMIGILTPDNNSHLKQNSFYPTSSNQSCFSIALIPNDAVL